MLHHKNAEGGINQFMYSGFKVDGTIPTSGGLYGPRYRCGCVTAALPISSLSLMDPFWLELIDQIEW